MAITVHLSVNFEKWKNKLVNKVRMYTSFYTHVQYVQYTYISHTQLHLLVCGIKHSTHVVSKNIKLTW